jgi:glycosyltransferase involved in cell wall biosynthesis
MTGTLDITFLSTSMGLGGADRQVLLLARELRSRGHDVSIVSVVPDGQMGAHARRSGIPVSTLGIESKVTAIRSLPALRRQVSTTDVLHSHMFHATLLARLARPLLGAQAVVSTIHNVYESAAAYRNPQRLTRRNRLYGLTDGLAERTTCVCRTAHDRYVDLGVVDPDRATVVYNGIDGNEFRADTAAREQLRERYGADGAFVWLAVGRFFEMKDYPNLLRAFSRTAGENTVLWIVGHGDGEAAAKRLAADLAIDDRVRFLGVVDDVAAVMRAADGFVLASRWEGFPMVLLEAGASGLPVVATRVGGVPELVEDGTTGLLVPAEDSAALAETMDEIVGMDADERRAMGAAGRERTLERFGIEAVADRWETLYRDVLSE